MAIEPLSQLFIQDADYPEYPGIYEYQGTLVQQYWNDFIAASRTLIGEKGLEGDRAHAYSEFISVADELIAQKISEILNNVAATMPVYINQIDEADSVLYK